MVDNVRVDGAEQLARIAGAAIGVGPQFRKELLAGIRKQGKPVIRDIKASAMALLPSHGGLNAFTAKSTYGIRTRTSGKQAGIRIVATKRAHDIEAINAGNVRHPVYGNRKKWAGTEVKPGFFDAPVLGHAAQFERAVVVVMEDLLKDIKRESGT